MKLDTHHRALLCAALETFQADTPNQADTIADLLGLFSLGIPYAPFRTAKEWHESQTS